MTPQTRAALKCADAMLGPQVPGGRYYNAYWSRAYEVLAIWTPLDDPWPWLAVRWADGEVTSHCTAWEARRDRAL